MDLNIPGFSGYEYGGAGVKAATADFDAEVRARAARARQANPTAGPSPVEGGTATPAADLAAATKPNIFQRIKAAATGGASLRGVTSLLGRVGGAVGIGAAGMDMAKNGLTVDNASEAAIGGVGVVNPVAGFGLAALKGIIDTGAGVAARYIQPERNANIFTPMMEQAMKNRAAGAPVNENVPVPAADQAAAVKAEAVTKAAQEEAAARVQREHELAVANAPAVAAQQAAERARLEKQYAPTVYRDEQPALPSLGTTGGIFTNLSKFATDLGPVAVRSAAENRDFKAGIASGTLGVSGVKAATDAQFKGAEIGIKGAEARASGVKANAAMIAALAKAKDQKKVLQDAAGNPVVVDIGTNTQRVPSKIPSEDEFVSKAKEDPRNKGVSDKQLREHYRKNYGV